ncbi:MAG: AIDA repeat-containing protein, partial [Lentisphaeria bacterium]|nr:AIDA repeat-containing protein [Lentisphaeria bacterium]
MASYVVDSSVSNITIGTGDYDRMYIYSGGIANSTTVNSSGYMSISSGGTANSTTVNSRGSMYISSGGTANSTTVNRWGSMYIRSGGVANRTTVNSGGYIRISSGGTAKLIKENGGYVDVADGANVTFASNTISGLNLYGAMTVHSNTVANSTTVN